MRRISKVRGRSSHELWIRGKQAAWAYAERLRLRWRSTSAECPSLPAAPGPWLASRPTLAALKGTGRVEGIAAALATADPEALRATRHATAELHNGRCSLLGFDDLAVGNPPDWHTDVSTGRTAPRQHWSRIAILDSSVVGDPKVLWEVNRHQYLLAPAVAWLADRQPRDFELVQAHLRSWLDANPRGMGVNWASSLEVAYRSISWCWLWWLLRSAPWDAALLARMAQSMRDHAQHIERYLSTYSSPNTHLSGEALGLFYIGAVLPEDPAADRWRETGAGILEACLDRHVLPDGVYFEQAIQYQRYTAEIFLHYVLLARAIDWPVAPAITEALHRQFEFLRSITSGSGHMPLVGDDDGGLLLPLDHRPPDDLSGLLQLGAVMLDRPDLLPPGSPGPTLGSWLIGPEAVALQAAGGAESPAWTSQYFSAGGFIVVRDGWQADAAVAVLDAGPHGTMTCGHAHADALSMTLSLGETAVFIDRGTATYSGDLRNVFRATESHNTLEFDGESSVLPTEPFRWGAIPERPTASLATGPGLTVVEAHAAGHAHSARPSSHRRVVLHETGGAWVVLDEGQREASRQGVVRWQLAPGLRAVPRSPTEVEVLDAQDHPIVTCVAGMATSIRIDCRPTSPRLGSTVPADCLELHTGPELRAISVVLPAQHLADKVTAATLQSRDDSGIGWSDALGRHRLAWARALSEPLHSEGWLGRTQLLWLTDTRGGEGMAFTPDRALAVDATELVSPDGDSLIASPSGATMRTRVFHRKMGHWRVTELNEPHGRQK